MNSNWSYRKRSIQVKIDIFFVPCHLEIWGLTLKNYEAPLLCCFKFCALFHSHQWIQTWVTVQKRQNWLKIDDFLAVWPEIWRTSLKNNRAPLLITIKLCAWLHHHTWIQTGVTVWKRLSWAMTSVTLTFDLWPWAFTRTSHLSLAITPKKFHDDKMMGT